jgi:tetratricopeptide (TPR) repeat protein
MFDQAEPYLQAAIQKLPDLTLPYHGLAEIYVQQGKLEKAIETYHQLTKIDQDDLDAWLELGNLQIHLKKINAAIYAFQQALKTNSNCDQAYQGIARIYANQEVYLDLAETFAAKAVKIDPSASNLSTFSYVYFKNGKYGKAKELILRAIDIEPKNQAYQAQLQDIQNARQNEQ